MVFAGEASWRWRMLLPSIDRSYDRFWRQAIRWLALPATDPVHVTVPAGGAPGDPLSLRIAARNGAFEPQRDAAVSVRVALPDGRLEDLPAVATAGEVPGFTAGFRPAQPGVFRVTAEATRGGATLGSSSAALLVGGVDLEMTDPRLNRPVLERIALATGGRVVAEDEVAELPGVLRARVPAAVLSVRRDLWHNGYAFAVIVLLLGAEWIARRRWGLR